METIQFNEFDFCQMFPLFLLDVQKNGQTL